MTGFKPGFYGIGSDRAANFATNHCPKPIFYVHNQLNLICKSH